MDQKYFVDLLDKDIDAKIKLLEGLLLNKNLPQTASMIAINSELLNFSTLLKYVKSNLE